MTSRCSALLVAGYFACLVSHTCLRAADVDLSLMENWFPRTSPTANSLNSVTRGDGRFVAVGNAGTIVTSEGGGDWSAVPTTFQGDLFAVRHVNGLYMAGTTNGILVSTNAQQWTYRPISVPAFGNAAFRFKGFAWGANKFVAIASSGGSVQDVILSSPDGIVWNQRYSQNSVGGGYYQCDVAFGEGTFVAVQNTYAAEHRFVKSSDGIDWNPTGPSHAAMSVYDYQPQSIAHGNEHFVAAGYTGFGPYSGHLFNSTDGANWSAVTVLYATFSGVAYGAGRFVALGWLGLRVSTNNGASWIGNLQGWESGWYSVQSVAYGNGSFVAVGNNGTIIQSATVEETAPFFITTPTNQVVRRGGTATLRSLAGGSEPLSYQWRKDGTPLINATNAILVISNVQPANAGAYTIVVSSPSGSITNAPVSLSVSFANIATYAGLTIDGIPGRTYRIEYLDSVGTFYDWQTLTNFVLPFSPYIWIDYQSPAVSKRFYRASELP